jgi:acyl-CoA reductase-like NAD-dependent aldehyde dehydrogenase
VNEDQNLGSWINGAPWISGDGPSIELRSPWNGSLAALIHPGGLEAVAAAVRGADQAQRRYARTPLFQRAAWLDASAREVERRADAIVAACVRDIGKPRRAAIFEVRRTVAFMRAVVQQMSSLGGEMVPLDAAAAGAGRLGYTRRVPYGVVAAVTPFNAPANLLMQKLAPALATGNAVVAKPSPEGTRVALIIAESLKAAGVPDGLYSVVAGGAAEAIALAEHPLVQLVTITGGTAAGEALARAGGAKKFIGELGGNSPNLVLADADLNDAAKRIAASAFEAAGQQCISAQRVIVESAVYDRFLSAFAAETRALKVGDPARDDVDLGPVVNRKAADRIMGMIDAALGQGARAVLGAKREGCVIEPTILVDAPVESRVVQEEIFGPAVAVMRATDLDDALTLANQCEFGLQAAVFTRNLEHAFKAAELLRTGSVWINEGSRFRLDNYPFGGIGRSGHGREGVRYALEEYTQWKFTGLRFSEAF